MDITSTFGVLNMNVSPSLDGLTDVVVSVVSQVVSTDGTYYAQATFTDQVGAPNPGDYTAYPDLTEAQVLTWVPDHGTDPSTLAYLASDIERQANPPVVTMSPPWPPAPAP